MILLALFLLTSFLLGFLISTHLKFLESFIEKLTASILIGLGISTALSFLISYFLGSLSATSILISIVANCILCALLFWLSTKNDPHSKIIGGKLSKSKIAVPKFVLSKINISKIIPKIDFANISVFAVFILIAYFNSLSITQNPNGGIFAIGNAWADYALHAGIINSFALRDNFPPIYPNLEGAQMRYPFLFDFLSAIMVKEGIPLAYSITIPNFLMIMSLISMSYLFLAKFSGNRNIAAIAIMLFFLNGNLGFMQFLTDYSNAESKDAFMANLPKAYSYLPDDGKNIQFMNLTYSVFIPQRATLMGFPIVMLILLILWRILNKEAENFEFGIGAVLISLLPMVHASSFAIAAFATLCVFIADIVARGKLDNRWLYAALFAALMTVPQILFINEQVRDPHFLSIQLGWMSKGVGYLPFLQFWLDNIGILLITGFAGFLLMKRKQFALAMPFLLVFLACNLVRFQPWEWDNIKFLMYWLFFMCIASAIFLAKAFSAIPKMLRPIGMAIIAAVVLISIFSGLLTLAYWSSTQHELWSKNDIADADFIKTYTPRNAIFSVAGKHNQLVYSIGGRQILSGYDGHLWSHGLDFSKQANDNKKILLMANWEAISFWNISYIYIGPAEINEYGAKMEEFKNNPKLEQVYENTNTRNAIFKVVG